MKLAVFAIYDQAAAVYMKPFPMIEKQAERMFMDVCADSTSELAKHPEDYALVQVGFWDDNSGEMTDASNTTIITGLEALARLKNLEAARNVQVQQKDVWRNEE